MKNLKAIIAIYDNISLFHHVEDNELGPATNLTMDSVKLLLRGISKKKIKTSISWKSIIPENVLQFNPEKRSVLFYTEPCFRKMHFRIEKTNAFSGMWKQPFLLWKFEKETLSVWALKTKPRSEDDDLYQAPFLNVYSSGIVCMGNVDFGNEENYFDDLINDLVDQFYNSFFTHTNVDELLKMNYMDFILNHSGDKNFKFAKYLVKTNYKIKDIL